MDQENDRLPAIVEYLKMNPLPAGLAGEPSGTGPGGQVIHVHEHHHYAPPAPPPPPPKPTVAEQVIPWLWVALLSCIIGTICAFILAVVMVALLLGLIGLALLAAVISHLVKTTRESQINSELAHAVARPSRRNR
jgi:hypothetical protein